MTKINQRNAMESKLDLREWWEMLKDSNEAESRVLSWEKWPFYWYDESKQWIITLQNGLYLPYKVSETHVILPLEAESIKKNTWKILLNSLKKYKIKLNYTYKVKDSAEAFTRVKTWEKAKFWFISEDKSTIRVLDFTKWGKPEMSDYPVKETKITYNTMEIQK